MSRVLVLGSTGMLGSAVFSEFEKAGSDVQEASRTRGVKFDATGLDIGDLLSRAGIDDGDFVINCVGFTKARIDESAIASRALAVRLNVDFPNQLALEAEKQGIKVIQVATDCVYSGATGSYSENADHDPLDVYGKTKSLGEAPSSSVMHLRCSLIGPELGRNSLFFEWVRQQPQNASINGFTNHIWNGLSSTAFAKIARAIIENGLFSSGVQHLVPADRVTKDELVRLELHALGRADVSVSSVEASSRVDRTLSTKHSVVNTALFKAAGYAEVPTVAQMVDELCAELAN
jgi:dTDP-4-dehydrorhamnose reductase